MLEAQEAILARLVQLEKDLCLGLAESNEQRVKALLAKTTSIGTDIEACLEVSVGLPDSWIAIAHAVRGIQMIASAFARQEHDLSQWKNDLRASVDKLSQIHGPNIFDASTSTGKRHDKTSDSLGNCTQRTKCGLSVQSDLHDQALNAHLMRRWMLENIDYPFPTSKDKDTIAEETNRGALDLKGHLRPEQATLWFINARRRSGWTSWARRFANSDKARLTALVTAIQGRKLPFANEEEATLSVEESVLANDFRDRGLTKSQLAELCKSEFSKVTEWIEQGSKERVGDWMDKVVTEAKASLKRKRKERRAARKLLAERRRGRAVAAGRIRTDESENEDCKEKGPQQQRTYRNLRPIRGLPSRHTSGASSTPSSLSSMVSGHLYYPSGSSSAATSYDSSYERGDLAPMPPQRTKEGLIPQPLKQVQHTNQRPNIEVSPATPSSGASPPLHLSRLPYYNPQRQLQLIAQEAEPILPHHLQEVGTALEQHRDQTDQTAFFIPPVTAAAALGHNWGMPVTSFSTAVEEKRQLEEVVDYGGWLAWSG